MRLTLRLRAFEFFRRTVARERVTLRTGNRPRTLENRNTLVRLPVVTGVKTGHTQQAGYVLIGSGRKNGITLVSAVLGAPSVAAREADTRKLFAWAFKLYRRVRPISPSEVLARVPIEYRRGAELALVVGDTSRRFVIRRGQHLRRCALRVPTEVSGPVMRGQKLGEVDICRGEKKKIATLPVVASRRRAGRGLRGPHQGPLHAPVDAAPGRDARAGLYARALAHAAARLGRASRLARGAGGRMIITVTLNTAIDKTLAVPNFRLGRRHRTVEQTEMPGGKGVNVARVLKTLGQPVIATGLAGGATGTRIVEQLTQLSVLSDFVRIREESRTNTAVIDPTTGEQTEINERGPRVSEQEIELFTDKLLYLAQGASVCVFAGSLPREVDIDVYARLIRELKRLGVDCVVDTDGDPLRRAVRAEPDVISPNVLEAEELVGHEFNDEEDHCIAAREMVGLGAHSAIMTAPDGCYALMAPEEPGGAAHALPGADAGGLDRAARRRSARATPSSPGSWPAATRGARTSTASPTAWRAARSRRSTSGPASSTPSRSAACAPRSRSIGPPCPRKLGDFPGLHNPGRRLAWTPHLPSAAKPRIPSWK